MAQQRGHAHPVYHGGLKVVGNHRNRSQEGVSLAGKKHTDCLTDTADGDRRQTVDRVEQGKLIGIVCNQGYAGTFKI